MGNQRPDFVDQAGALLNQVHLASVGLRKEGGIHNDCVKACILLAQSSGNPEEITLAEDMSAAPALKKFARYYVQLMKPIAGLAWKNEKFICTPIQAPRTVGTSDRASRA